jgi:hypothetical protein
MSPVAFGIGPTKKIDPCELVTTDDLNGIYNATFGPGAPPPQPVQGRSTCIFQTTASPEMDVVTLSYVKLRNVKIAKGSFKSLTTLNNTKQKKVRGVGNEARYLPLDQNAPGTPALTVRVGKLVLSVQVTLLDETHQQLEDKPAMIEVAKLAVKNL